MRKLKAAMIGVSMLLLACLAGGAVFNLVVRADERSRLYSEWKEGPFSSVSIRETYTGRPYVLAQLDQPGARPDQAYVTGERRLPPASVQVPTGGAVNYDDPPIKVNRAIDGIAQRNLAYAPRVTINYQYGNGPAKPTIKTVKVPTYVTEPGTGKRYYISVYWAHFTGDTEKRGWNLILMQDGGYGCQMTTTSATDQADKLIVMGLKEVPGTK